MKDKKRIIMTISLFAIAVVAGIIQYRFGPFKMNVNNNLVNKFDNQKDAAFGEAVMVSNVEIDAMQTAEPKSIKSKVDNSESEFEQAKIERDEMRSRNKEQLEAAVAAASDEIISTEAEQRLLELTEIENMESKVESLLNQKGYKQTMVYISANNCMDIVVNSPKLTSEDATRIADTASRHSGINVSEIVIKNLQ